MKDPKNYRPQDYEVKEALDGKRFDALTPALQNYVGSLFPRVRQDDVVACELCDKYEKPDVRIVVGDEARFVSLKSGRSKSIHYEPVENFILFLRELGVSVKTQKVLLLFHYGDGTLTGKGETRMETSEVMERYASPIRAAIQEINQPKILRACLKRFVFTGTEKRQHAADTISFGDITTFLSVSKDEVFDFVMRQNYGHIRAVHIGPMLISPWLRNVKHIEESEWKRGIIHVTWPYLLTDIQRMIKRRGH